MNWVEARDNMLKTTNPSHGSIESKNIGAIRCNPTKEFVAPQYKGVAYADSPIPVNDQNLCFLQRTRHEFASVGSPAR